MLVRTMIFTLAMAAFPALAQDASSSAPPAEASAAAPAVGIPVLSDADLELVVRAGFTGAKTFATSHGNYFARDGVFPPLREALVDGLVDAGFAAAVPVDVFPDADAAKRCRTEPGTELRAATNSYGDGLTLVAVTDARAFAYAYDPHKAAAIVVEPAADCAKTP